ncbi:MAG: hypothetical protein QS748_09280 [Candidatus Endonucleobacter bathymodioli]|uniref:Uncharacterized protein n=1 Tax=Candidatus Endonucleibacter bathymodioli TaxID=539814 RepID=A0AA90NU36_9GAMM|nr:hypothetical protein [Candidatus Endonucleobacter bathymodioli]
MELNQRGANLLGYAAWNDVSYRVNEIKEIEKRCKGIASDNSFLYYNASHFGVVLDMK